MERFINASALLEDWHGEGLGGDNSGQLGDGTTTSKLIPTTVPGLTNVKQLSTGSESPLR